MSAPQVRASLDKLIDQYGWEQVCDAWNDLVKEARPKHHTSASRPTTPLSSSNAPRRSPSYLRMTHLLGNLPSANLPSLPDPLDNRISSHSGSSLDVPRVTPPVSEKRFDFSKSDRGDETEDLMSLVDHLRPASTPPPAGSAPTDPLPKPRPMNYASFIDRPMPKRPPRPESGTLSAADLMAAGIGSGVTWKDNRSSDSSGSGKLHLPYEFADDDVVHRSPSQTHSTSLPTSSTLSSLSADRAHGGHRFRRRHTKSPKPSPRPSPGGSPPKLPPPSPIDPLPAVPSRSSSRTHHKSPGPGTNIAHTPTMLPYTFADDDPEDTSQQGRVRADVQQWQWETTDAN